MQKEREKKERGEEHKEGKAKAKKGKENREKRKEKMWDRDLEQKSGKPFQNRHFNHFPWILLFTVSQTM